MPKYPGNGAAERCVSRGFRLSHRDPLVPVLKTPAFAWIRRIKRPFVKLDALAQTLDHAKSIVIHRSLHHLEHVIGICVRCARHKGRSRSDQLLHGVDRLVDRAPDISLALENRSVMLAKFVSWSNHRQNYPSRRKSS